MALTDIRIVTRFGGRCLECDTPILPGERVVWMPGTGIRHADVDQCSEARADGDDGYWHWDD